MAFSKGSPLFFEEMSSKMKMRLYGIYCLLTGDEEENQKEKVEFL